VSSVQIALKALTVGQKEDKWAETSGNLSFPIYRSKQNHICISSSNGLLGRLRETLLCEVARGYALLESHKVIIISITDSMGQSASSEATSRSVGQQIFRL
jgi:hypothetical protein